MKKKPSKAEIGADVLRRRKMGQTLAQIGKAYHKSHTWASKVLASNGQLPEPRKTFWTAKGIRRVKELVALRYHYVEIAIIVGISTYNAFTNMKKRGILIESHSTINKFREQIRSEAKTKSTRSLAKKHKLPVERIREIVDASLFASDSPEILKFKYGVSRHDVDSALAEQKNKCKICRTKFKSRSEIHIDHCHESKKFRGLLCKFCNTGLGLFKDSPDSLKRAIRYLAG